MVAITATSDTWDVASLGGFHPGLRLRQIPIENLLAVPVQHAVVARHVVVDRFEIFDAMRLARDVGVDRERDDLGALRAFGVEPVELVDACA